MAIHQTAQDAIDAAYLHAVVCLTFADESMTPAAARTHLGVIIQKLTPVISLDALHKGDRLVEEVPIERVAASLGKQQSTR